MLFLANAILIILISYLHVDWYVYMISHYNVCINQEIEFYKEIFMLIFS